MNKFPVMRTTLSEGFNQLNLFLNDDMLSRFSEYYAMLEERGRIMNLTAITGEVDTARLHFLDCCALLTVHSFDDKSVIDVGTGAGFPGIPLKIASSKLRLTLLDSQKKRVDFLSGVCGKLGFSDVECIYARAEEAARNSSLRENFDIAVSRAVAKLDVLSELCLPFVRPGGVFIAMKGPDCDSETEEAYNAVATLGGEVRGIARYDIPSTDIVHSAVIVSKIKATPDAYPRRFNKIQKSPL